MEGRLRPASCRNAQTGVQFADHVQAQAALAVEHPISSTGADVGPRSLGVRFCCSILNLIASTGSGGADGAGFVNLNQRHQHIPLIGLLESGGA